jgi:excinuclease UvrABC helicase subunit UvrB
MAAGLLLRSAAGHTTMPASKALALQNQGQNNGLYNLTLTGNTGSGTSYSAAQLVSS